MVTIGTVGQSDCAGTVLVGSCDHALSGEEKGPVNRSRRSCVADSSADPGSPVVRAESAGSETFQSIPGPYAPEPAFEEVRDDNHASTDSSFLR